MADISPRPFPEVLGQEAAPIACQQRRTLLPWVANPGFIPQTGLPVNMPYGPGLSAVMEHQTIEQDHSLIHMGDFHSPPMSGITLTPEQQQSSTPIFQWPTAASELGTALILGISHIPCGSGVTGEDIYVNIEPRASPTTATQDNIHNSLSVLGLPHLPADMQPGGSEVIIDENFDNQPDAGTSQTIVNRTLSPLSRSAREISLDTDLGSSFYSDVSSSTPNSGYEGDVSELSENEVISPQDQGSDTPLSCACVLFPDIEQTDEIEQDEMLEGDDRGEAFDVPDESDTAPSPLPSICVSMGPHLHPLGDHTTNGGLWLSWDGMAAIQQEQYAQSEQDGHQQEQEGAEETETEERLNADQNEVVTAEDLQEAVEGEAGIEATLSLPATSARWFGLSSFHEPAVATAWWNEANSEFFQQLELTQANRRHDSNQHRVLSLGPLEQTIVEPSFEIDADCDSCGPDVPSCGHVNECVSAPASPFTGVIMDDLAQAAEPGIVDDASIIDFPETTGAAFPTSTHPIGNNRTKTQLWGRVPLAKVKNFLKNNCHFWMRKSWWPQKARNRNGAL
ncbi:hypothetical protein HK102_006496 [Quaeritorhiza haematococci]|nr:hypothetical protein HK102_006496 [Quaeritorhiza haematococci]